MYACVCMRSSQLDSLSSSETHPTWNNHIQYITHKAVQVNGFLYRNLRQCPSNIKSMCYKSIVCPVLEYASTVWDPHTNINITKL